jgi:hypothetical protein
VDLEKEGVELVLAHVDSNLEADLDRHHVSESIGRDHIYDTLRMALSAFRAQN